MNRKAIAKELVALAQELTAAEHDDYEHVLISAVASARRSLERFDAALSKQGDKLPVQMVESQVLHLEQIVKVMKQAISTHKSFE